MWLLSPYGSLLFANHETPTTIKKENLKGAPLKGVERKCFCERVKIPEPTTVQKRAFDLIRETIASDEVMRHANYDQEFIFYVDGSREHGYGVAVYQEDKE